MRLHRLYRYRQSQSNLPVRLLLKPAHLKYLLLHRGHLPYQYIDFFLQVILLHRLQRIQSKISLFFYALQGKPLLLFRPYKVDHSSARNAEDLGKQAQFRLKRLPVVPQLDKGKLHRFLRHVKRAGLLMYIRIDPAVVFIEYLPEGGLIAVTQ